MSDKDPSESVGPKADSAFENPSPDSILTIDEVDEVNDRDRAKQTVNQKDGKPQQSGSAERSLEEYENDAFEAEEQSGVSKKNSVFGKNRRKSVVKFLGRQISAQSAKKMVKRRTRSRFPLIRYPVLLSVCLVP